MGPSDSCDVVDDRPRWFLEQNVRPVVDSSLGSLGKWHNAVVDTSLAVASKSKR